MVLVKVLMEIDPLSMRGSMVMMMAVISPLGGMFPWQNTSSRALDWSCPDSALRWRRFVPKACFLFFLGQNTQYSKIWASGACQGAHKDGGAPSTLVTGWWPPLVLSSPNIFYIFQKYSLWRFMTFGVVQNRSLIFAPFPAQNSSCRHSPSLCKPCKIRENRHKYYDIMCNNNP